MSYEGYEQLLCENGHYSEIDAYETMIFDEYGSMSTYLPGWKCKTCGGQLAWYNCVDETNGSYDRDPDTGEEIRIDNYVELEVDKPAVTETCDHCGHTRVVEEVTYKIPTKVGHIIDVDADRQDSVVG